MRFLPNRWWSKKKTQLTAAACTALLLASSLAWPLPETAAPERATVSLRITDRSGQLLREVWPDGRGRPVALANVAPAAVQALIATEDRFFRWHPGVNPLALGRAAWQDLTSGRLVSGGSTITMQVARRLRGPDRPRTLWQKVLEMHLAVRLELHRSKREILALWLNRVAYGNHTVGIEPAAQLYFGKSARRLTTPEAAYLAGLPQQPTRYNPFRHPAQAKARQRRVLAAMQRAGYLNSKETERLSALPLGLQDPRQVFRTPHFTERLLQAASQKQNAAGGTPSTAEELRTTLDLPLQRQVEKLARGHLKALGPSVTNMAAIVLDNETGAVRAYLGSADFWDDRIGGQNNGVRMLRQPGSSLKPFMYARALASRRYAPSSILPDLPLQVLEAGGAFSPANYDRTFHGPVPLRQALASSYNVPAVRLAREMGPPALLRTLHSVGFSSLDKPARHYGVGLTLGSGEVRLVELARAYASLARGGTLPPLRLTRWRRTARGDTLPAAPARPSAQTMLSAPVAYLITDILKDPEARAPGFGRYSPLELPFPAAVKTGTSKDYRDNWTVGYTPRYTVAVWAGNFDGAPMKWTSGVSGAGPLFHAIMMHLHERDDGGGKARAFARPDGLVERRFCPLSGKRPGPHCPTVRGGLFLRGTAPTDTCRVHRQIRVDRRTGLRAQADTPPQHVRKRLFTVYPSLYHGWMRAHDRPLPPPRPPRTADARRATAEPPSKHLRVQYPADGTRFRIDPVLRRAYQQVELRGAAPSSLFDVHWSVDGERLPGDYRDADWRLRPGTHQIVLRATDRRGHPLRSRPATVVVEDVKGS